MNPSMKLLLLLIIALEISFTTTVSLNVALIILALIYLLGHRTRLRTLGWLLLIPLLPAIGLWSTQYINGSGDKTLMAWVLFTRIYAFVFTGATFTLTTDVLQLTDSLEQNWHLPAKFSYGVLAAYNLVPRIQHEVQVIRAAGLMRGQVLSFWSPQLYFKAILVSINWSQNLARAMRSHGFVEDAPRTHYRQIPLTKLDWTIVISGVLLLQVGAFVIPWR
ncbi:energy-coupling factor transporter transmembrane component T [Lactiplantibacillus plantarum]|uniref:energy-coupling factor transporter transmembrane component T n=1 Tax=Lactiplantibacillus plantarum TaxID=1590 RepID=UPI0015EB904A|nr:energy-coupling factor transporter transmembrane component T [Lactiplantibacillus plantarum]MBA3075945.1 energy-coupling factor transporter transmembrane protein EcfT [Lactiplantibacillus plantarum]MBA3081742.1 energy-coupling factor transporter transmembrane protein EcfT [Lactiplantibacillus plantarum]MDT4760631.1 energy-coupling factor transporter transmembrane component T [Lactiplantibacillus plantarum]MDY7130579.1 energy-coupling factor transporter transmembrane component T [Lactiplantib